MTSTISEFVWSRPALADCVSGMLVRDTRGCALDQTQRFNFWPAEWCCVVGWRVLGEGHLIDQLDHMERPWTGAKLPGRFFALPRISPVVTWNPGEVYYIWISFYPDALSAMTGIDLSSFTGRAVLPEEALPQPLLDAFDNFFDSVRHEGPKRGFSVLEDKIELLWAGRRPAGTGPRRCAERSKSIVHRAMMTGSGRSTRQIARRIKSWTGVTERDLEGFARMEQLSVKWIEAARKGNVDWAALAAEAGFTDQAHMIRRWQKHTGFTPKQAQDGARCNEAFWFYRLMARLLDETLERSGDP